MHAPCIFLILILETDILKQNRAVDLFVRGRIAAEDGRLRWCCVDEGLGTPEIVALEVGHFFLPLFVPICSVK